MIRDKRKIDAAGKPKGAGNATPEAAVAPTPANEAAAAGAAPPDQAAGGAAAGASTGAPSSDGAVANVAAEPAQSPTLAAGPTGQPGPASAAVQDQPAAEEGPEPAPAGTPSPDGGPPALGAELEALRSELDERLRDLQRVTAEYANYRKRVERDRGAMAEQAVGLVISALVPILDDLDRAREHGDLVGHLGAVAEQINATLAKFGLTGFGEPGDVFDPTRHEAVTHERSAEVTEPTCISVMRRGYLLGDRLLRPALVAVADPE